MTFSSAGTGGCLSVGAGYARIGLRSTGLINLKLPSGPATPGHLHHRLRGPERFEIVKGALSGQKDVDHDLVEVHQDPGAVLLAGGVKGGDSPGPGGFADGIGDGARLTVGVAFADDEEIGQGALLA